MTETELRARAADFKKAHDATNAVARAVAGALANKRANPGAALPQQALDGALDSFLVNLAAENTTLAALQQASREVRASQPMKRVWG